MTMLNNKGYNFNKNNSNASKHSNKPSLESGAMPSMGNYMDKKEAEELKDLNVLYSLFPKDGNLRKAAEKKFRKGLQ